MRCSLLVHLIVVPGLSLAITRTVFANKNKAGIILGSSLRSTQRMGERVARAKARGLFTLPARVSRPVLLVCV